MIGRTIDIELAKALCRHNLVVPYLVMPRRRYVRQEDLMFRVFAWALISSLVCNRVCAETEIPRALNSPPSLVLEDGNRLELLAAEIFVSRAEVRVRHRFYNPTETTITTNAQIEMPELSAPGYDGSNVSDIQGINFLDFSIDSDGQPVNLSYLRKAMVKTFGDDRDVTEQLASFSVPLEPSSHVTANVVTALPDAAKAALLDAGALIEHRFSNGYGEHVDRIPAWNLVTNARWIQTFPAASIVVLVQRYQPIVESSELTAKTLPPLKARTVNSLAGIYCVARDSPFITNSIRSIPGFGKARGITRVWMDIPLVPPAWLHRSIAKLDLTIDLGASKSRVAFCEPGTRDSPARSLRLTKRNAIVDRPFKITAFVHAIP